MNIHCVIAEYVPNVNATKETRVKTVHSVNEAEIWINKQSKPAMTYIDGMQNHDAFMSMCCMHNSKYWKEHRKEID